VQTISQILQNALASSTKTASAPTPQQAPDADVVDMIFDKKASETPAPTSAPVEKKAQIEASDIALAAHGLKLARALEQASELVKEANLVVTATPTGGSISVPAATNNSVPAKYDVPAPTMHGREMPTSEKDPVSRLAPVKNHPSKSAALVLANAKLADAAVLERYNNMEAAATLRKEAAALKAASDGMDEGPSAKGDPAMPTSATSMTGGGPGPSLSNERAINMTRAEARNPTTAEMSQVIRETPKVDPVTKAVVGSSEGVKASAAEFLQVAIKKAMHLAADPNADPEERSKAASLLGVLAKKEG
jgi:hypothetical protein